MSRRKQPRASKALRDAATERMVERLSSDINRLATVEVQHQFGATQTVPPPAPAWRSMASAPRDGSEITVLFAFKKFGVVQWSRVLGEWRCARGRVYFDHEIEAWAPIPEWTGEVAE